MDHESLAVVRKKLRVNWYRCPVDKKTLGKLSLKSDLEGWFQAGGHLTLFVCSSI